MDEIVNQVVERTGLPEAQARMAVETVVDLLKEKLPAPIAGQLDNVIGGESAGGLGGLTKGLGGLMGNR